MASSDLDTHIIDSSLAGARLDRVVMQLWGLSRKQARIAIGEGRVWVGKRRVRIASREVKEGQRVRLDEAQSGTGTSQGVALPEIVFLDKYLVVVNKPPGLLSEPDRAQGPNVLEWVPELLAARGEHKTQVRLVHRLDAGTSGLLVLTRTPMATSHVSKQFAARTVRKTYAAIATGCMESQQTVDAPIGRVDGMRHGVQDNGKPAQTTLEPWKSAQAATLVRAVPRTGRTHQIRVHLAHVGHPIVGDRLYGGSMYLEVGGMREAVPRFMLHAISLHLIHPKSEEAVSFEAPVPEDFAQACRCLGWDMQDWT